MSEPRPPEDEPYRVWHRAASEQLISVASGLVSDPGPVLWRAQDFANRALAKATPLEAIVTVNLVRAIVEVRAALTPTEDPDADVRR